MSNRGGLWLAFAATAWLLGVCASTPPPTEQVAVASAAVTHAVNAGAQEAAPGEMRAARDKLERAKQAMADKARKAAQAVQDGNSVLREEMNRKVKN